MIRIVFICLALVLQFACTGEPEIKKKQSILFYSRHVGSNNYINSYFDRLVITNYQNNTLSIGSLYQIAKHYIDTVKADLPVKMVLFLGLKPGGVLPNPKIDYIDEQKKLYIMAFVFNDTRDSLNNLVFDNLSLWINSNWYTLNYGSINKNYMDTLLKSDIPFDNTKMLIYQRPKKQK